MPAVRSCHRFSTLPPFAYQKMAEEREERGLEYKERCSAINVQENLGTTILSVVIVQHLSDVNRIVCCAARQTIDSL